MTVIAENVIALAVVIAVGWLLRRTGAIGPQAGRVLSSFVYWAAAPALLFYSIAETPISQVVGRPLAVAAISGLVTAVLFALVARLFMKADVGQVVLGAMSASLNNAAYIGIPIGIYVLGHASYGVPVMIFQLGFLTPTFYVLSDLVGSHTRPTVSGVFTRIFTNPMVIAAMLGFLVSAFDLHPPSLVVTTSHLIGDAAPGTVLIALGASLVGQTFSMHSLDGRLAGLATGFKLVVQPLVGFGAGLALGLSGHALMAVTIMAGLPTAQNAFIAATRAKVGEKIAEATVVITTIGSLPLTVLTASLFLHLGA
ncbi:AEC family transporter [Acidipropionibacterium jensenii]|uniref:AEC family transporter n=1 Tax=Acidipropionibacterium jensenii TaxID=1749 RepID=A0A3T0S1N1_9ACTN|nr:AEC family transporter [Acidipropionibacterium jensenii]AZZ40171.1 AEC family transporter [Acidipropionibacterium jensenii]